MSKDEQTVETVWLDRDLPAGAPSTARPPAERYQPLAEIGQGSMGTVERVYDAVLEREVVRKVIRPELWPMDAERFLAEARVTAQLQHPGVISVHDLGVTPDGRPCYTMEEVVGRTLDQIISEPYADDQRELRLRRISDAMRRVAETVAYAHSRGVIHRDLKPANIMLGAYGEVRVLDWGLARGHTSSGSSIASAISTGSRATQSGDVLGTPAYMPPEQALGDLEAVGPHSDVYALGATLYHLLAGVPPYEGSAWRVVALVVTEPPRPLARVTEERGRPAPPDLVSLVERAMARDPSHRPSAADFARELGDWLDGARRRESALQLVEQADALDPRIQERRDAAATLRAEAERLLGALPAWEPEIRRHRAWAMQDEADALAAAALQDELAQARLLHSALETCPRLPEADARLATLYRREHAEAEARRDSAAAVRFEALLRTHDHGEHAAWLEGTGALTLLTDPPGAEALLYREEQQDRRLVPVFVRSLGQTPLIDVELPRGSYFLVLRHPHRVEVRYPFALGRGERWRGVPPEGTAPQPILLPESLGPDDCYVPAGWFWSGGDGDAVDGLPRLRRWVDGFVARRFPVTNAEYLAFLNDLVASGQTELAESCAPSFTSAEGGGARPVYARQRGGTFAFPATPAEHTGSLSAPVTRVDWRCATRFAAWEASRVGHAVRLLHDQEWEKAARGVDGRHFPWGDAFDATRAQMAGSSSAPPTVAPVYSYGLDESLYGVRGAAGNVRDWCLNPYTRGGPVGPRLSLDPGDADDPYRMVRGGSWASEERFCRLASRFADPPSRRVAAVSFRVGYSLP